MNAFMRLAAETAQTADGEIPVAALIVCGGQILARVHNQKETLHDPTAHAEILAIRAAAAQKNDWRLDDCDLYVTLEPCAMCAAAINEARLRRVYFGAYDPQYGAANTIRAEVYGGIEEDLCAKILQDFFAQKR